jgi:hypothetical protein
MLEKVIDTLKYKENNNKKQSYILKIVEIFQDVSLLRKEAF